MGEIMPAGSRTSAVGRLLGALTTAALVLAAAAPPASAISLSGSGSALVQTLENDWAKSFISANTVTYPNLLINFTPNGSAEGSQAVAAGSVDFGASDAPMSAYHRVCRDCFQIPWALSATAVGIHVHDLRVVRLTGPIIAEIYTGQITNWADPAIERLNHDHMPKLRITPVFQTDESGDTYSFTRYESQTSLTFKRTIGIGVRRRFTVGIGARGSTGVIRQLRDTDGAIAYVSVSALVSRWPRVAAIKNRAGRYTLPDYYAILDAGLSAGSVPGSNQLDILNPPARFANAYVIPTFAYVIVPRNAPEGALLRDFIGFAIGPLGQSVTPGLGFVALESISPAVLAAAQAELDQIA